MNASHSPGQYTTPCNKFSLGNNVLQTVGEDRVEIFLFLQFLTLTSETVEDFLGGRTASSLVVVAEVLAGTDLKHIHEGIFALMGNANKELEIVGGMVSVIKDDNILDLLAE